MRDYSEEAKHTVLCKSKFLRIKFWVSFMIDHLPANAIYACTLKIGLFHIFTNSHPPLLFEQEIYTEYDL